MSDQKDRLLRSRPGAITGGTVDPTAEPLCDCCEINDYGCEDDPYGPCDTCGHAPEEHG